MKKILGIALATALLASPTLSAFAQNASSASDGRQEWQKFQQKFDAANTTHDGHLTLAQAQAGNMPIVASNFSAIDTGHNGYVTLKEVAHFFASKRSS